MLQCYYLEVVCEKLNNSATFIEADMQEVHGYLTKIKFWLELHRYGNFGYCQDRYYERKANADKWYIGWTFMSFVHPHESQ